MTTALGTPSTTFSAPDDRTATEPPEHRGLARDEVRLLVASPTGISHARFRDLPCYLRPGDLLVVNNSATVPGELDGHWRAGRPVVVHLATELGDGTWVAELRSSPHAAAPILDGVAGQVVQLPERVHLHLLAPYPHANSSPTGSGNRLWRVRLSRTAEPRHVPVAPFLHRHGRPVAYGYLAARYPIADYQTIFAARPGSAEMPSAGRPFTPELVTGLVDAGVGLASITLHAGLSSQDAHEAPQTEWFEVNERTAGMVAATRRSGGRVIAVGTTVTRALESTIRDDGTHGAAKGWTSLVIDPARGVHLVDGVITGWHNPEASHLLLVEAVAGAELTQKAYDAAVTERYLWHEFGDAGLLLVR